MLAKNKEHSARSKGDRRLCFESRSCVLLRKPFPHLTQLVSTTAARLLEAWLQKSAWSLTFTLQKSGKRVCFYLFKSIESIAAGGQPQGLSLQTVGNRQFENFVPLTRQRCIEVATPYKYASIKLYGVCEQMMFAHIANFFTIHFAGG